MDIRVCITISYYGSAFFLLKSHTTATLFIHIFLMAISKQTYTSILHVQ